MVINYISKMSVFRPEELFDLFKCKSNKALINYVKRNNIDEVSVLSFGYTSTYEVSYDISLVRTSNGIIVGLLLHLDDCLIGFPRRHDAKWWGYTCKDDLRQAGLHY